MFETVDLIGDRLINVINKDFAKTDVQEMRLLSIQFTSDVIGNVAFGLEFNCRLSKQNAFGRS